jgi:aspartate aminotransferase
LGAGAYRDDDGKPYTLKSVKEAEKRIFEKNMDHEYASIQGIDSFIEKSIKLAYGENHPLVKEGKIAGCQSLSGTGAIRLGLEFLRQWYPNKNASVYIPDPSWPTHKGIATQAGFEPKTYRYYEPSTKNLN